MAYEKECLFALLLTKMVSTINRLSENSAG